MIRKRTLFTILPLLLVGGFLAVRYVFALPPAIGPRAPFNFLIGLLPINTCSAPNGGQQKVQMGIDGTGPFFAFWAVPGGGGPPQQYTYRPRGLAANTVAQFGDGGIAATEEFRKLYERWVRSTGIFSALPVNTDNFLVPCFFAGPGGAQPPTIQMTADVESCMMKPTAAGAPSLQIAMDATNGFEDYEFDWNP